MKAAMALTSVVVFVFLLLLFLQYSEVSRARGEFGEVTAKINQLEIGEKKALSDALESVHPTLDKMGKTLDDIRNKTDTYLKTLADSIETERRESEKYLGKQQTQILNSMDAYTKRLDKMEKTVGKLEDKINELCAQLSKNPGQR